MKHLKQLKAKYIHVSEIQNKKKEENQQKLDKMPCKTIIKTNKNK